MTSGLPRSSQQPGYPKCEKCKRSGDHTCTTIQSDGTIHCGGQDETPDNGDAPPRSPVGEFILSTALDGSIALDGRTGMVSAPLALFALRIGSLWSSGRGEVKMK